jgi:putative ABC transport system permease protein
VLARLLALPRVITLALSNAFRNLGRVATTQLALAGAGITFMAVMSARTTMIYTLGTMLFDTYAYQVQLDLEQVTSMARIEQVTQVTGVAAVEVWRQQGVTVRRADAPPQPTDPSPSISGVPVPTSSYMPMLKAGRLLAPGDTYAIVMQEVLARDAGVTVGDWVILSIADPTNTKRWISQKPWQVVGVIIDPNFVSGALVPRETLFGEIGRREGNRIQIQSADTSATGTLALAEQVRAFFDEREIPVRAATTDTATQRSERQLGNLSAVIILLLLGAVIVAVIGAISLNGTLAISVLERRREIGVLRAIGATPGTIRTQFLIEGMVMAVLSWLIALVFAYPAGLLTAQAVGASLRTSVIFHFDWLGVWLWLALACAIAVIASLSPAQQAIRASV